MKKVIIVVVSIFIIIFIFYLISISPIIVDQTACSDAALERFETFAETKPSLEEMCKFEKSSLDQYNNCLSEACSSRHLPEFLCKATVSIMEKVVGNSVIDLHNEYCKDFPETYVEK